MENMEYKNQRVLIREKIKTQKPGKKPVRGWDKPETKAGRQAAQASNPRNICEAVSY